MSTTSSPPTHPLPAWTPPLSDDVALVAAGSDHRHHRVHLDVRRVLMFGVLGIPIRDEFGLTDVQLSWITAVAVLNGAIWRLPAGIVADRYGGRIVFTLMLLLTAIPAYLVAHATSYVDVALLRLSGRIRGQPVRGRYLLGERLVAPAPAGHRARCVRSRQRGRLGHETHRTRFIAAVPAAGYLGGFIPGGWRFVPFLYAALLILMGPSRGSSPRVTTIAPVRTVPGIDAAPAAGGPGGASACTTSSCSART